MCGCHRITYLCLCRHKERVIERCIIYQLREERSCWAFCFPKCKTRVTRHRVSRVCRDCQRYFYETYGESQYERFIQCFLEYKESMGWAKTAIDPRTVPRSVLVKRQSAPPVLGTQPETQPGRQEVGRGAGQPFPVHQPMPRLPTDRPAQRRPSPEEKIVVPPPPAHLGNTRSPRVSPGPDPQSSGTNQGPGKFRAHTPYNRQYAPSVSSSEAPSSAGKPPYPFLSEVSPSSVKMPSPLRITKEKKYNRKSKSKGKGKGKGKGKEVERTLPTDDPDLFAVGSDSDNSEFIDYDYGAYDSDDNADEHHAHVGEQRAVTPSPPATARYYNGHGLPPGVTVVPELAHLAQGRDKEALRADSLNSSELMQPKPTPTGMVKGKGKMKSVMRGIDTMSESNLVKRLTKAARKISIPNLEFLEQNGKYVPRVMSPPRGRRLTRTPPSSAESSLSPITTTTTTTTAGPSGHNVLLTTRNNGKSKNRPSAIDIALASHSVPGALIPGSGRSDRSDNSSALSLALAAGDVPEILIPGHEAESPTRRSISVGRAPSLYFVAAHRDLESPTGASVSVRRSPSHATIAVPPPQRLEGVLIPECPHFSEEEVQTRIWEGDECAACRGAFFKERGLPTEEYLRKECRSAPLTPVLLSVRTPRRRYSCAVQSCYCRNDGTSRSNSGSGSGSDAEDEGEDNEKSKMKGKGKSKSKKGKGEAKTREKCLSCRERDAIAETTRTTWV
ncbi:hypothetical protein GGR51DRAFT_578493 [Nemania sp. FL0031]|nr:hypothetical protein GGR51DRAFT_578493 [Nemania sp. FL0031]